MNEPAIVGYGRHFVDQYPQQEYVECLQRAFKRDRADFITLDDNRHGQRFLAAATAWAIDAGWLYCDRIDEGDQEVVSSFRLTDEGKRMLL